MSNETTPAPALEPAQPATPAAPAATPSPEAAPPAPVITDNRPAPETPAVPPPSAISPDGKLGENWFLGLGDEFAPHAKDLGKHKDIRSIITELDYFRKNGVAYPGEGADPKAVERFRAVAGVPDAPDGYGITAETMKLPEGMAFDQELADAVTKAAHASHTPPAALAAIVGEFNGLLAKRAAQADADAKAAAKATQDALVAEWGANFPTNASTVRHITSKLAEAAGILPDDPAIGEFLADINAKPALSKLMLQVSKLTREDSITMPSGFGDLKSPAQVIAEIKAGTHPVWGQKWVNGSREEKQAAYDYVKALSAKIAN